MKLIACRALKDEFSCIAPNLEVEWTSGMLHRSPEKMRSELNERIAATPGRRTILLGYGRCGNGTVGLKAGPHRLVLPVVDDCIALLLGSRRRYLADLEAERGTLYYTRGWLEELGDDPYQEYLNAISRLGEAKARKAALRIMRGYTRFAIIDTGAYDVTPCRRRVEKASAFFQTRTEVIAGDLRLIRKLTKGRWGAEFIVVEPGAVVGEAAFWSPGTERNPPPDAPVSDTRGPPVVM